MTKNWKIFTKTWCKYNSLYFFFTSVQRLRFIVCNCFVPTINPQPYYWWWCAPLFERARVFVVSLPTLNAFSHHCRFLSSTVKVIKTIYLVIIIARWIVSVPVDCMSPLIRHGWPLGLKTWTGFGWCLAMVRAEWIWAICVARLDIIIVYIA